VEEDTYNEDNNSDCSSYNRDNSISNDHTINRAIDMVNEWTSSSDDDDGDGDNDGDCNNNDEIKRYVRQHEGICLEYRKTQFEKFLNLWFQDYMTATEVTPGAVEMLKDECCLLIWLTSSCKREHDFFISN